MKRISFRPDFHPAYWLLAFVLLFAQTAALIHSHQHDFHVASSQCVIYLSMERNIADITDIQAVNISVNYFLIDVFHTPDTKTTPQTSTPTRIRAPPVA